MERAFWDVVAVVDSGSGETYDAILGGLSIFLKLKLIFFQDGQEQMAEI